MTNEERIAALEAQLRDQAMQYLALDGQATEALDKIAAMKAAGDGLAEVAKHNALCAAYSIHNGHPCSCGHEARLAAWSAANGH